MSNLTVQVRFGFTKKKRFLPVRDSGSVRLPGFNYPFLYFGVHFSY